MLSISTFKIVVGYYRSCMCIHNPYVWVVKYDETKMGYVSVLCIEIFFDPTFVDVILLMIIYLCMLHEHTRIDLDFKSQLPVNYILQKRIRNCIQFEN